MGLDRFERANLNRLLACVAPIQNRIDRIKSKVKNEVEKAANQVHELEKQIEDYKALMQPLLDKDRAASEPEEEAVSENAFVEDGPIEFEVGEGDIDIDNEEEFEEMPLNPSEDLREDGPNIGDFF